MKAPLDHIVVLGAGAIGAWIGGQWAAAGLPVTLIGRTKTVAQLGQGYTIAGQPVHPEVTDQPTALASASLIVLTVRSTDIDEAVATLRGHARPGTPVLSLLNGISPAERIAAALPEFEVIRGMVPYNIVWTSDAALHQQSTGRITVGMNPATEALREAAPGLLTVRDPIEPVLWGKLLLNLNNPINALSGIDLHAQLSQRGYRRIYAAVLREALSVLDRAGLKPAQVAAVPPHRAARALGLPDWLFNRFVLPRQNISPGAMASMARDLAAGRPTEIETLNGDIVRLATAHGHSAPINAKLVALVREAETSGRRYSAAALAIALDL